MQTFLVGGAVRDKLLQLPIKDCDYMVVGATPKQLLALVINKWGKIFLFFYTLKQVMNTHLHGQSENRAVVIMVLIVIVAKMLRLKMTLFDVI